MTSRPRPRGFAMRHISVYPDLTTYAVPLPDGSYNRDRNGNPKITRVTLEPDGFPAPRRPEGLTDSQWAFATSSYRQWRSAVTTFGDRAEDIATELARSGCVILECDFRNARVVLPPRGWVPHPGLQAAHKERSSQLAAQRAAQEDEARCLAAELAPYPAAEPLVTILSAQRGGPRLDQAIEVGRALLANGALSGTGEEAHWIAVRWLQRGKRADYALSAEPISEGGQGAVFRATHKPTDTAVALKRLRSGDDDAVARMRREIDMGQQYGDHPNVMPVLDVDPNGRWFIMPYANGSAADHADRLQETSALRGLVEAVCEGVRQPHEDGWTHRDIKPANVLLLDGQWVVADWGLVRRPLGQTSDSRRTQTGTGFGSIGFAAPELASGNPHKATPATDIYSIGRLIGAILTGQAPEPNIPLLPEDEPWRTIAAKATQRDPGDRPQNVDEFLRLLKHIP